MEPNNEYWSFEDPPEKNRASGRNFSAPMQALRDAADANPGRWVKSTVPKADGGGRRNSFLKRGYEAVVRVNGEKSANGKTLYDLYIRRPVETEEG